MGKTLPRLSSRKKRKESTGRRRQPFDQFTESERGAGKLRGLRATGGEIFVREQEKKLSILISQSTGEVSREIRQPKSRKKKGM